QRGRLGLRQRRARDRGAARGERVRPQRLEALHHERGCRPAVRLLREDRPVGRARRDQRVRRRGGRARLPGRAHRAEDGDQGVDDGRALLRRLPRPGREPARRGGRGLRARDARPRPLASGHRGAGGRARRGRDRVRARVRAHAGDLRRADREAPARGGDAGRHGDALRGRARPALPLRRRDRRGRRRARPDEALGDDQALLHRRRDDRDDRRGAGARRLRLHPGAPGGADDARRQDHADLRGHEPDPAPRRRARAPAPLSRVELTNADRVLFPEEGITKGELFAYYRSVAPVLVPHLRNRPFTMKRWREGLAGPSFFQKQAPKGMPSWIPTRRFQTWPREGGTRMVDFPLVNSRDALLWMVQMHCIDMNAWYSRVDRPDRPDFVLFDLDPPEGGFALAVRVAHLIREALRSLELESHVKTSGADGIHVLVPIARRHGFDETYEFAELLSRRLEAEHPGELTTEWLKRK